jgi:hypothetical protein
LSVNVSIHLDGREIARRADDYQRLNRQARPYPSFLLPISGTALGVFAAGFLGWNDCIHLVRAGLVCDFVDNNQNNMLEMKSMYPPGHTFHVEDAWDFAERASYEGRQWDVVTVDPFFEDMARKAWDSLDLWLSLAGNLVTLTVHPDTELPVPEGWSQCYYPRGDNVDWLVMQRAA